MLTCPRAIRLLLIVVSAFFGIAHGDACTTVLVPHYVLRDFSVEIHDWNGRPIAGASVLLSPSEEQANPGPESAKAVTTGNGFAEFCGVAVGDYKITTEMSNGEDLFVTVVAAPSTQLIEPELSLKWPVLPVLSVRTPSGRLQTGGDLPLHISLVDGESGKELSSAATDAMGDFRFPDVSPGVYFIRVTLRAFEGDIAIAIEPGAEKSKLDLALSFSTCGLHYGDAQRCDPTERLEFSNVCGVVLDPTGAVIGDAKIELLSWGETPSRHVTAFANWRDGTFALKDVLPGEYTLSISREGFRRLELPVRVSDGSGVFCANPITVTLALFPSCSKAGVAVHQ
jgi:Carboxypeptidase regulatory-like domain